MRSAGRKLSIAASHDCSVGIVHRNQKLVGLVALDGKVVSHNLLNIYVLKLNRHYLIESASDLFLQIRWLY